MKKNTRRLNFSKMHGLKNDFMVVETLTQDFFFTKQIIKNFSNRYTGIGFDQLLIIEPPIIKNTDFNYRIFNSNGIEVEQCGNGARCFAKFVYDKNFIKKKKIIVSTKNRILILKIKNKNISVNIGSPQFQPKKIPFLSNKKKNFYTIYMNSKKIFFGVVSVGNPHCVLFVKDINNVSVKKIGSFLENNSIFPEKTNVGFVQILNKNEILLRVFERGVGETKSCGSGACAAVIIGIKNNKLSNSVKVHLKGGNMLIKFDSKKNNIYMIGTAKHIYDGYINY